jgi:predicted ATP-binding protein involved in virulence
MRITSMSVKGLFGVFNHTIPLQSTERVTIIHGPNGYGKTVMLKMIAALFDGTRDIFEHVPFDEFRITLDDGTARVVRRTVKTKGDQPRQVVTLTVLIVDRNGTENEAPDTLWSIPKPVLDRMDQYVPAPYHRQGNGWTDSTGRTYSASEIVAMFPRAQAVLPKRLRPRFLPPGNGTPNVFFVETNRLGAQQVAENLALSHRQASLHFDDPQLNPAFIPGLRVEEYSKDVSRRIQGVLALYAKHSQELDRTFPERLVQFQRSATNRTLDERDILDRMAELEQKRRRLITLGFLDSESGLRDLAEEDVRRAREALTIYVDDVSAKLSVFEEMADKAGELIDIVNDRFSYKNISIHRDRGFCVSSDSGEPIKLCDLSSGEQHELVVLYELLFKTPANGLVLVDEPEISLHVGWQSRFLADLISILELTNAYAIVATHSPAIVGPRWDLTIQLTGPASPGRNQI